MTLEFHATPEEVMRAVEALEAFALENGVPQAVVFRLTLSLEECASNVVNHALLRDPEKTFQVGMEIINQVIVIELHDKGPAFDPTQMAERTEQSEDDLPGGWGIQLVRRNMDCMEYQRVAGANVLRLTKQLESGAAES